MLSLRFIKRRICNHNSLNKVFFVIIIFLIIYSIIDQFEVENNVDNANFESFSIETYKTQTTSQPMSENHIKLQTTQRTQPEQRKGNESTTFKRSTLRNQRQKEAEIFKHNYNIHIFYFTWFQNPEVDEYYSRWNLAYIPDWRQNRPEYIKMPAHQPPYDISSNFYPELGCYSSNDQSVIDTHFKQLKEAGIGVVLISLFPFNDMEFRSLTLYFQAGKKYDLKIGLHVVQFRSVNVIRNHLIQILTFFTNHTTLYRLPTPKSVIGLPVVYIYDSYSLPTKDWETILKSEGKLSVRNTEFDAIFIGLIVNEGHLQSHILMGGFDGFYTYFVGQQQTWAAKWSSWAILKKFADEYDLIWVPSVGPGYIDTRIRTWNRKDIVKRRNGAYYRNSWEAAGLFQASYVSINSFNDWNSGNQIEPAKWIPRGRFYRYRNYTSPNQYLKITQEEIQLFQTNLKTYFQT